MRLTATQAQGPVAVTMAALLLIAAVRWGYLPLLSQIAQRRSAIHTLRVRLSDSEQLIGRLAEREAALERAKAASAAMEQRIGAGQPLARVLEAIGVRAKERHVELTSVQPGKIGRWLQIDPVASFREVPVTMELTGRYRMLGEFLGDLTGMPALASVRSIRIMRSPEAGGALRAELVLSVYLAEGAVSP